METLYNVGVFIRGTFTEQFRLLFTHLTNLSIRVSFFSLPHRLEKAMKTGVLPGALLIVTSLLLSSQAPRLHNNATYV